MVEELRRDSPLDVALKEIARHFPESPEGVLNFAVIHQAVKDMFITTIKHPYKHNKKVLNQQSARHYLRGEMFHAMLCGVEPDYVRKLLKIGGFDVFTK